MEPSAFAILGTGIYAPIKTLTNAELSLEVETSDQWIVSRTGIRERRIAGPTETVASMSAAASADAIRNAGLQPTDIDLIILATLTPDVAMPATACLIQQQLGVSDRAACFDLNAACSGFIYALDTAWAMLQSGRYRHALVIGAEKLSKIVDWNDRSTCVLFGDGAGAVVLGPRKRDNQGIISAHLNADGKQAGLLCVPNAETPENNPGKLPPSPYLQMKGREIFKIAVREMEDAARNILEQTGFTPDEVACVIPHQANLRIIDAIAQYLKLPSDRFFVNLERYGNTSAASIPIAIHEAHLTGRIKEGDLVLLVAFGAGLTYGSALLRW